MPMNKTLMGFMSRTHAFWYLLTGGRLGGRMYGSRVVLLTTIGRKSGRPRTTPLMSMLDGENIVVIASQSGHDDHPAWYLNLRANPEAELQVGSERSHVRAETANDEERARLWPRVVEMYAGYEEYQKGTRRKIPVVILRPVGSGATSSAEDSPEVETPGT